MNENIFYHIYADIDFDNRILVNLNTIARNHRKEIHIGGFDADDIASTQRVLLVYDKNTTVILYLKIHVENIDFSKLKLDTYTKSSTSRYKHHLRYIDRFVPNTFLLIENIAKELISAINKSLFSFNKTLKLISVSDTHGDVLLFLLPLFMSNMIINLKIDSNTISFNTFNSNIVYINNGDFYSQTTSQYIKDEIKIKRLNRLREYSDELIGLLVFIFSIETTYKHLNAYFILGNHDKELLTRHIAIELNDSMKQVLVNRARELFIKEASKILDSASEQQIAIFKQVLNNEWSLFHSRFDELSIIDCLDISVCVAFENRMFLFQHGIFNTTIDRELSVLAKPQLAYIDTINDIEIIRTPILQPGVNILKLLKSDFHFYNDTKFDLNESINYFIERFRSLYVTKFDSVNIVLGHRKGYALLNDERYYKNKKIQVRGFGNKYITEFNDMLGKQKQHNQDIFDNIIKNKESSNLFDCVICLDSIDNSLMNSFLYNSSSKDLNYYLYKIEGGAINRYYLALIIIVIVIIVIQIVSRLLYNNRYLKHHKYLTTETQ